MDSTPTFLSSISAQGEASSAGGGGSRGGKPSFLCSRRGGGKIRLTVIFTTLMERKKGEGKTAVMLFLYSRKKKGEYLHCEGGRETERGGKIGGVAFSILPFLG